jgi:hypothetical protein
MRDLGGDREVSPAGLERAESARPFVPQARFGVARPELNCALENFLRPLGVTSSQEDFAEPPVHARVARRLFACGDEDILGLGQTL